MPRKPKIEKEQELSIYLLLSPTAKKFLVSYCNKENIRETYRHNLKGRRDASRAFIQEISPERPCLFVLETFHGTVRQATNLMIVWTKIFMEKGYESYNRAELLEMVDNLYLDTKIEYDNRRNMEIGQLISCDKCIIPTYNYTTCSKYPFSESDCTTKPKDGKEIHIRLSEEEYETISEMAKQANMQLIPYIRKAAMNPTFIKIDYSPIDAHTKEMAEVRNIINRIVFTIDATNNYLPRDIELIVNLMTKLYEGENDLIKTMRARHYTKAEIEELDLLETGGQAKRDDITK